MFVIAGVTGNTGSVVANSLLDAGRKVRVLVRSAEKGKPWAERGAEVAVGSLDDPERLTEALRGAQGAYLLSPPDLGSKDFIGERFPYLERVAHAVRAAKPGHIVFLSSIGAQHAEGTGPVLTVHHAEKVLGDTGVPSTFVRAGYFVENWALVGPIAKKDGVLPSFVPRDKKVATVGTRDIGETSAKALLEGPKGRRVLELAGPADVTPDEVAGAFSRIFGRPVTVAEAPLAAVVPTFTSFGVSEDLAKLYQEMYGAIVSGKLSWERPSEVVRGRIPLEESLRALT